MDQLYTKHSSEERNEMREWIKTHYMIKNPVEEMVTSFLLMRDKAENQHLFTSSSPSLVESTRGQS